VRTGYCVLHRHRENDDSGGVAFVYSDQLQASTAPLDSAVVGVDVLVCKLNTRRRRLKVAVVYRPPSSSPTHGISVTQFCSQFGSELLDELLALPRQLVV